MVKEIVLKDGIAVSSKDLMPGEVLLSLSLIVEGPGCKKNPVCLGCLKPVRELKRRKQDLVFTIFFLEQHI